MQIFTIKNISRIAATYYIDDKELPKNVEISKLKGKIPPDDSRDILVKYMCSTETIVKSDITVKIRGGRTLKIPLSV